MMILFDYIIWSPDPAIVTIPLSAIGLPDRPIVWYGLLFALGFLLGQQISYRIFKADGQDERDVDTLTTYMVVATIIGARLGHCLFYNPIYYLSNPIEILKVWEGGLASHGGAIGIFVALWIYANYEVKSKWFFIIPLKLSAKKKKKEGQSYLWILDRIAIVVALTGALIRTGNFMNSEMEGVETRSNFGVVYARASKEILDFDEKMVEEVRFEKRADVGSVPGRVPIKAVVTMQSGVRMDAGIEGQLTRNLMGYQEVVDHVDFKSENGTLDYSILQVKGHDVIEINGTGILRHTPQLYEAIACIIITVLLLWLWKYKRHQLNSGVIFGIFMMLLWSDRFFNEFFKMNQEAFEASLPINMGQILSIPMFLVGVAVFFRAVKKG
ncbi:MAG: prolipoprotein diacylglyceryl transferase [Flammeovirgaceae bacterium]|jgi:phosphatidylglycerol---prolipoprotein diacylglyceryl transferase|nr:prolipoprotein diacylglyceryl transferase [Flammeovirgaceae bacterium]|tara:strand:- start:307 stop:1455 length:1149 start_codon:yes stop_codon:yes gene_type:complete